MGISNWMRAAHIATITTIQEVDFRLLDHWDFALSFLLVNHHFGPLVPACQVLAATTWVLCEYLHFRRSPCRLIVSLSHKGRLRYFSLRSSSTGAYWRSAERVWLPCNYVRLPRHVVALGRLLDLHALRNVVLSSAVSRGRFLHSRTFFFVDSFAVLDSCFLANVGRCDGRFELRDFKRRLIALEHLVWVWYSILILSTPVIVLQLCQSLLCIDFILLQQRVLVDVQDLHDLPGLPWFLGLVSIVFGWACLPIKVNNLLIRRGFQGLLTLIGVVHGAIWTHCFLTFSCLDLRQTECIAKVGTFHYFITATAEIAIWVDFRGVEVLAIGYQLFKFVARFFPECLPLLRDLDWLLLD